MKSNRTHQPPPRVENLGQGEFYYNFNVVKYRPVNEHGEQEDYWAWDYEQVRVKYPVTIGDIKRKMREESYDENLVNTDEVLIEADQEKVQSPDKVIDYSGETPSNASDTARYNLKNKNWKLNG